MPQFERRLYEPSDDMRAFDASEDDLEEEGSRLPLLIVIALVVLASFAGVVWLAYTQGVQRGRESAPRVIAAQPAEKTASANKNPYAGLNIYKPSKPSGEQIDQDTVPPSPVSVARKSTAQPPATKAAAPAVKPAVAPVVPANKSVAVKPTIAAQHKAVSAPTTAAKPIATATKPVATAASKVLPAKPTTVAQNKIVPAGKQTAARSAPGVVPSPPPTPVATTAPRIITPPARLKPSPKPNAPTTKSSSTESVPATESMPAKVTIKPAPAITAETKPTPNLSTLTPPAAEKTTTATPGQATQEHFGGFLLQIGSYKSEAEANASWQTYKSAHPVVAGYVSDIRRAELGAKGTWYRLRVGPFASLTEANTACAKIKASGGNCFPAKR